MVTMPKGKYARSVFLTVTNVLLRDVRHAPSVMDRTQTVIVLSVHPCALTVQEMTSPSAQSVLRGFTLKIINANPACSTASNAHLQLHARNVMRTLTSDQTQQLACPSVRDPVFPVRLASLVNSVWSVNLASNQ